ncbi:ArsR family transcriptional regulator [Sphaerisporangium album]|uniref:ArsR family transcriptional regulator n=2 Tax=Sphaerisporangium album TaxID=509200 RepID=A0A367FFT6_9ACTN|nr:ArsR family transcriptional regulator [Sphaerisporangium album]
MTSGLRAGGDTNIAVIGALVADAARCRILLALDDGRVLPASRLAAEAGVSPATASSHLGKLTEGGLLAVQARGRHRYYRLAGPAVAQLIEALQQLAPPMPIHSLRQHTRAQALREARTCYDHLAGRLGVDIMAAMIDRGQLSGGDGTFDPDRARHDKPTGYGHDIGYALTESGHTLLTGFGVRLPPHRPLIRYCVDWSEQRHHLAGALGRGLLERLTETGWLRRAEATRAVHITDTGREGLHDVFGIDPPSP